MHRGACASRGNDRAGSVGANSSRLRDHEGRTLQGGLNWVQAEQQDSRSLAKHAKSAKGAGQQPVSTTDGHGWTRIVDRRKGRGSAIGGAKGCPGMPKATHEAREPLGIPGQPPAPAAQRPSRSGGLAFARLLLYGWIMDGFAFFRVIRAFRVFRS